MSHPVALFNTVAVIGLGLIGGSFAKLIRHELPLSTIWAYDLSAETLEEARFGGIIDGILTGLDDPKLAETDIVILATHLNTSQEILQQLSKTAFVASLKIMDLGSTKASICALAEALPGDFEFIGGHPLAGREISGFENSLWNLFHSKRFLLTPCQKTSSSFQTNVLHWLQQMETLPVVVDRHKHDELMSLVSHFPQFYAIALANLLKYHHPQESLQYLGGGIDDQMRLMASPFEMWGDVFTDNKAALNSVLSDFIQILTHMQQDLQRNNMAHWFQNSHEIYQLYQNYKQKKLAETCCDNIVSD